MEKEKFLAKAKRSRKTYIPIYILVLVGLGYFGYSHFFRLGIGRTTIIFGVVGMLLLIKFTEYHRFKDWWGITDNSIVESRGILNKTIRKVTFPAISDIDINQPFYKRLFNFGDINVRLYSAETSFTIKNINFPDDFADILQDKISKSHA